MAALLDVILPVFLVIGFGYVAARSRYMSESAVDSLLHFAQNVAVPCLLFLAIWRIDLGADFDGGLLASFYGGAFAGFALGFLGGRFLFRRSLTDSIAIGFCGFFSNTVLLGLPITERAYGSAALVHNYAILSIHALVTYGFGITAMELARAGAGGGRHLARKVATLMLRNPLLIGILLGLAFNLSGAPLPGVAISALETLAAAALPAALFALGGVLSRYRPEGDRLAIAWVTGVSLLAHPAVTWLLASRVFALDSGQLRSAVLTAAMAPGLNTYLFANMYGAARRVAASSVLVATALSIATIWFWLAILP